MWIESILTAAIVAGAPPSALGPGVQPLHHVDLSTPAKLATEQAESASAHALVRGDDQQALDLAEAGLRASPDDAWLLYDRGAALASLGRTDEAVASFDRAEEHFASDDLFGRSVSAYHSAISLEQAGRCEEARGAFRHYAEIVRPEAPEMALSALQFANACLTPGMERQPVSGRSANMGVMGLPPRRHPPRRHHGVAAPASRHPAACPPRK